MVNPIQITQPQAYSGGADFTPLSKLYDVYKASQQRAMEEQALAKLGADPTANTQFLIQSGVPSLASMGVQMQNKLAAQAEDVRQFNASLAEKQAEFKPAQATREAAQATYDEAHKLAQKKFEQDSSEYRGKQLDAMIAAGRLPPTAKDDPAWQAWMISGQNVPAAAITGPQQTASDRKAIRDADQQVMTVDQTINQLDTLKGNLDKALHLGPLTGAVGKVASFLPEGYGKEAGVATELATNEALRSMMGQVRSAFGSQPSDRENKWMLDAQASVNKSAAVQTGILDEGRKLLVEKKKFYQEQAQEMRPEGVKGYYGRGGGPRAPASETGVPEPKPGAPALADFMAKARAANPGYTDSEIAAEWKKRHAK